MTVTVQVADTPSAIGGDGGSARATAVTRPFASTVATLGSLEVQVTVFGGGIVWGDVGSGGVVSSTEVLHQTH